MRSYDFTHTTILEHHLQSLVLPADITISVWKKLYFEKVYTKWCAPTASTFIQVYVLAVPECTS